MSLETNISALTTATTALTTAVLIKKSELDAAVLLAGASAAAAAASAAITGGGGTGAVASVSGRTGVVVLTKIDVGLGSVDNTADTAKPVSTAQAAANLAIQTAAASDATSKSDAVAAASAPIGHVGAGGVVHASVVSAGAAGFMSGADKTKLDGIAAGATVSQVASVSGRTGIVVLTKADVGLGSVDNTTDIGKPVSTAQATADTLVQTNAGIDATTKTNAAIAASTPIAHVGSGGVSHAIATTSVAGFMSGADKTKLDGLTSGGGSGGFVNPMTTEGDIIIGAVAGSASRLGIGADGQVLKVVGTTLAWGSGSAPSGASVAWVDVTGKPVFGTAALLTAATTSDATDTQVVIGSDTRLINARTPTTHIHSVATISADGFMSLADKTKLDGIAAGANVNLITLVAGRTGDVVLTKADVGLSAVDNTSDAAKPVSTAQSTANLADQATAAADATTKANAAEAASTPIAHVGSGGVSHSNVISSGSAGFMTGADKAKLDSIATGATVAQVASVAGRTGIVVLAKADVGLGSVDNTADSAKPVSTAQAIAIALKANSATTIAGYNIADAYTKTETDTRIQAIVGAAPAALDTLVEITTQLLADESAATALTTAVSLKAPIANPTFTGTVGGITKSMVGLANVDNTSDNNKPVSTAQQTALISVQSAAESDASLKANAASLSAQAASTPIAHIGSGAGAHSVVTTTVAGFMSGEDKTKLDSITPGATVGMANPMTASGDLIVGGTSGVVTRLGKGTDTQVLTLVSGLPAWTTSTGGGGAPTINTISSATKSGAIITSSPITVTGMSITPGAGNYIVNYNSQFSNSLADVQAQAAADVITLYNALNALPATNTVHAAAFGAETLGPGVYTTPAAGTITGTLTLDAGGNPGALFVFRFGAAFATAAGASVILVNGATSNNVWFVAEGAGTTGAGSNLKGSILINQAAVAQGATVTIEGRLLTVNGANALAATIMTEPTGISTIPLGLISVFSVFCGAGAPSNAGASVVPLSVGTGAGAITGYATATVGGTVYAIGALDSIATYSLYQNGILITNSSRSIQNTVKSSGQLMTLQAISTVTAGQAIDVKVKVDLGSFTSSNRIMTLVKVA